MSSSLEETGEIALRIAEPGTADALLCRAQQGLRALDANLARLPAGEVAAEDRILLVSLLVGVQEIVTLLERRLEAPSAAEGDVPGPEVLSRLRETRYALDQATAHLELRRVLASNGLSVREHLSRRSQRPWAELPASAAEEPGARPATEGSIEASSASQTSAQRAMLRLGRVLTALGVVLVLFLLFEFWGTDVSEIRTQRKLLGEFSQALAAGTAIVPDALPVPGQPVALLRIPAIGLEKVVVEGTTPEELKEGPGHFRDTPLPGQAGNSVIAGRRTTYGAPFQNLSRLVVGDAIEVTTGEGTFRYTVAATGTIRPGQLDVLSSSSDDRLTLLTSDPAFLAEGRLGVIARLDGEALAAPVLAHPVTLAANETGLSGDVGGLAAVIVCGELLALVLVVAWTLYRRWNRTVTYLLTTPILLALLYVLFENLDRLLPGTL